MNKAILTLLLTLLTLGGGNVLFAANDPEKTEPVWVISWAAFFLFLGLTVFFMSMPSKRRETTLNEEEVKEYENELARKRHALIKEEVDEFED
ncbi:MAG: hypothetical protein IJJ20_06850 [Thermoguttaceae bacterium]|nr:hypothetical protein [Thermoguttaceae bacterium]